MTKLFFAVLRLSGPQDVNGVFSLANKVIKGLTDSDTVFTDPDPSVADLTSENKKLGTLITEAEGGSHQKVADRNNQSKIVHGFLRTLTNYVDGVANGDKAIILLSGFDASKEPEPQPVPSKVVIKRIVDGPFEHSAKIFIQALGRNHVYLVELTTDEASSRTWKVVLRATNSRKLILEDLERGQEIFVRISGFNAAGQGAWSDDMAFIPQ